MTDWQNTLKFLQGLTQEVGGKLLSDFGQVVSSSQKDDGSLITQSDRRADRELKQALASRFPNYGILTEESERVFPSTEWCWVVDPIDGTTNFARGIPIWGISLGLLHEGVPVFGYVYMPPLDRALYGWFSSDADPAISIPPNSAFLNGNPIACSRDSLSKNHLFSLCSRSLTAIGTTNFPCKLRMLGVASYNLLTVALGSALGAIEATPKIWDIAAAWTIVQAAGALWLPLESEPIFPLHKGKDYGDRSYPTLVVSYPELIATFRPLASPLVI